MDLTRRTQLQFESFEGERRRNHRPCGATLSDIAVTLIATDGHKELASVISISRRRGLRGSGAVKSASAPKTMEIVRADMGGPLT